MGTSGLRPGYGLSCVRVVLGTSCLEFIVSCIIHGMPSIVDPCLYNAKGSRSGDHLGIYKMLDYTKHIKKEITFRRHCASSLPEFMKDVETSTSLQCTSGTTDDLVDAYNSGIKVLI